MDGAATAATAATGAATSKEDHTKSLLTDGEKKKQRDEAYLR